MNQIALYLSVGALVISAASMLYAVWVQRKIRRGDAMVRAVRAVREEREANEMHHGQLLAGIRGFGEVKDGVITSMELDGVSVDVEIRDKHFWHKFNRARLRETMRKAGIDL